MKSTLILFLLIIHSGLYGQSDSIPIQIIIPKKLKDCNHGHICCNSGCRCCPSGYSVDRRSEIYMSPIEIVDSSDLRIYEPPIEPDYSQMIYPKDDGLTYNQYVGETVAGFYLANGWRKDTINGGVNKEIYTNPYISSIRFEKQKGEEMIAYRYENGKLFNGRVREVFTVRFTPNKIAGYLPNGQSYYESKNITVEFSADCVNGLVQGRSVLLAKVPQYGLYDKLPLSECNFEKGEIVGVCKHWDLNSVEFTIDNGNVYSHVEKYDYFEFRKLLEFSEITYVEGSSEVIQHTIYERNKKTGKFKPKDQKLSLVSDKRRVKVRE
jgi:hypothetical protein